MNLTKEMIPRIQGHFTNKYANIGAGGCCVFAAAIGSVFNNARIIRTNRDLSAEPHSLNYGTELRLRNLHNTSPNLISCKYTCNHVLLEVDNVVFDDQKFINQYYKEERGYDYKIIPVRKYILSSGDHYHAGYMTPDVAKICILRGADWNTIFLQCNNFNSHYQAYLVFKKELKNLFKIR